MQNVMQMLVILHKMTTRPRKMTAGQRKMTAAPHKMTAALNVCQGPKGGLEEPQGTPPTPILEKTLVSRNDF